MQTKDADILKSVQEFYKFELFQVKIHLDIGSSLIYCLTLNPRENFSLISQTVIALMAVCCR